MPESGSGKTEIGQGAGNYETYEYIYISNPLKLCYIPNVIFNPLKKKRRLLYVYFKTQFVPRSKHIISVIKTSKFMLYGAKGTVCSEINTKHTNTEWQNVKFLNVDYLI
jgi:hypothetical protein